MVFLFYKYTFIEVFYFKYVNIWDFNVNTEIKDQYLFL